MARKVVSSRQISTGSAGARALRVKAYQRLFGGSGNKDDADVVLTDLAVHAGYHTRPSFAGWTQGAEAFLLHSALANARCEMVQHILTMLGITDDQKVELENAARLEAVALRADALTKRR